MATPICVLSQVIYFVTLILLSVEVKSVPNPQNWGEHCNCLSQ